MSQDNGGFRSLNRTSLNHCFENNLNLSNYKTSSQVFSQWNDNHNPSYLSDLSNSKLLNNRDLVVKTSLQIVPNIPIFDIELKDTHCHLSNQNAQFIRLVVESFLKDTLEKGTLKIDYQAVSSNPFQFQGRIFTNDCSEFMINIFKLKQRDINGNISVIEIRKTSGDSFGYYKFEELLMQNLEDKKMLKKKKTINDSFGLSPLGDFGSLTLDDDIDDELDLNIDNELDDNTSILSNNDEEFDHNLCETLLQTLYDKDSYREEYIHDAYQFSSYLKSNDKKSQNMIDYIVKNEKANLVKNIMNPITNNDVFCAFIILHILEAIECLLSIKEVKSQLVIPDNFKNNIVSLYKTWSNENGVVNSLGPITVYYPRSQQIERRCESILRML